MTKVSIKGFELRNIISFKGHEEEDLQQGNIYYKGKKIGWYSQDAWGGEDIVHLDNDYVEITKRKAMEYLKSRFEEKFLHNLGTFFLEILELNNNYQFFLEEKEQGMEFIATVCNENTKWCTERTLAFRNEKVLEKYLKEANFILVKKYSSENDFIID